MSKFLWYSRVFPSHPSLSLQADGFGLGCSPSSHAAALGGDYRTHTAGTLWHDWDRHGTVQPSPRPTHPRYSSLTDWIHLHNHTHADFYSMWTYTHPLPSELRWGHKPTAWSATGNQARIENKTVLRSDNQQLLKLKNLLIAKPLTV